MPENDRLQLKALLANCPELTTPTEHVRSFAHMVTNLQGDQLPEWIEPATATSNLPSLSRFAWHLERDIDAVIAGLTQPWNSGVVEGHALKYQATMEHMDGVHAAIEEAGLLCGISSGCPWVLPPFVITDRECRELGERMAAGVRTYLRSEEGSRKDV
ncbi:hypothetical protein [Streptomyces plumbiresistens]|uniref:hypothetical protein n=1 Tax=Streptomyces plumbiresistens TaxID=511811 RepID=UPI0031F1B21B